MDGILVNISIILSQNLDKIWTVHVVDPFLALLGSKMTIKSPLFVDNKEEGEKEEAQQATEVRSGKEENGDEDHRLQR